MMECPECGSLEQRRYVSQIADIVEWTDGDGDVDDYEIQGWQECIGKTKIECLNCGHTWEHDYGFEIMDGS